MVKLILFDFDGVIVNPMYPDLFQAFERISGVPWERINRHSLPFWLKARVGAVDEGQFWKSLERICRIPCDQLSAFGYSFFTPTPGIREFIGEIRRECRVGILSNHLEQWFRHIFEVAALDGMVDFVFTSFGERLAKPDRRLYQRVLDVAAVAAPECLFIDDMTRNLQAAARLGINTIHFCGMDALREQVRGMLAR